MILPQSTVDIPAYYIRRPRRGASPYTDIDTSSATMPVLPPCAPCRMRLRTSLRARLHRRGPRSRLVRTGCSSAANACCFSDATKTSMFGSSYVLGVYAVCSCGTHWMTFLSSLVRRERDADNGIKLLVKNRVRSAFADATISMNACLLYKSCFG